MPVPIHVIDAFTDQQFGGNPAAVVLFDCYPDDTLLQSIAAENNLAETAYPVPRDDGDWDLRWFTPTTEVPLCGHATLASAHVLFSHVIPAADQITFVTRQSGNLTATRSGDAITLDFPAKPAEAAPDDLSHIFGYRPDAVLKCPAFVMAILPDAKAIRHFVPDRTAIMELDRDGLIITAPGDGGYDCISRFFTPAHGIDEDPVTGGAHTMIVPYWADRLGKTNIRAWQASARGGELVCRLYGDRVEMKGVCVPYMTGEIAV